MATPLRYALIFLLWAMVAVIYAPLIPAALTLISPALSLTHWQALFADPQLPQALLATLVSTTIAAVGALLIALLVIVALLYTLLSALAALALGLKMPNLTWTNEITPIKQSACVAIALFGGWAYALLLGGGDSTSVECTLDVNGLGLFKKPKKLLEERLEMLRKTLGA